MQKPIKVEEFGKLRKYPIREGYFSVTSIINYVFGVPPEIVTWSVKQSANAIYQAVRDGETRKSKLLEIGERERFRLLRESGKKGTAVHDFAQGLGEGVTQPIDTNYEGYYEAVSKFFEEQSPKTILQEKVVASHKHKYAGRFDNYCELFGRRVLLDYKTSNFVRSEYGLQLEAYAHVLRKAGFPVERKYILHLKKNGSYELIQYNDSFQDFLNVLEVFKRKVSTDNPPFEIASDFNALRDEKTNQTKTKAG